MPGTTLIPLYRFFIKASQVGSINLSSQKGTRPRSRGSDRTEIWTQNENHLALLPASGILKDFSMNVTQQAQDFGSLGFRPNSATKLLPDLGQITSAP